MQFMIYMLDRRGYLQQILFHCGWVYLHCSLSVGLCVSVYVCVWILCRGRSLCFRCLGGGHFRVRLRLVLCQGRVRRQRYADAPFASSGCRVVGCSSASVESTSQHCPPDYAEQVLSDHLDFPIDNLESNTNTVGRLSKLEGHLEEGT